MDLKDVPEFYEVELGESLISRTETLGELLASHVSTESVRGPRRHFDEARTDATRRASEELTASCRASHPVPASNARRHLFAARRVKVSRPQTRS
jgi:hypothetical protein